MKTIQRIALWAVLIGLAGWSFYALWKESCGCSTLPIAMFFDWMVVPLTTGALTGVGAAVLIWLLFTKPRRARVGLREALCIGLILGTVCSSLLSKKFVLAAQENWWTGWFQEKPVKSSIGLLKRNIEKVAGSPEDSYSQQGEIAQSMIIGRPRTDHDSTKLMISMVTTLFRQGVDGCFLLRSLGHLTSNEERMLSLYIELSINDLLDSSETDAASRAMNALWGLESSAPVPGFLKKLMEFRFLSSPEIGRFQEAASKVQYAMEFARKWPYNFEHLRSNFAEWAMTSSSALSEETGTIQRAMGILREKAQKRALDAPRLREQRTSGAGVPTIYHLAQIHDTDGIRHDPEEIAKVAGYQLAMLQELDRLNLESVAIITEGYPFGGDPKEVPSDTEKRFRQRVAQLFRNPIPSSVDRLSSDQAAYLFFAGAGLIYSSLHPDRTLLYPDLTVPEYLYNSYLQQMNSRTDELLINAAARGENEFEKALKTHTNGIWTSVQTRFSYREQRIADGIALLLKDSRPPAIVVSFGAAHNLSPAFKRLQENGLRFKLVRIDWMEDSWLAAPNTDPLGTAQEQRAAALSADRIFPESLDNFVDPIALAIAIQKLDVFGLSIRQTVAIARLEYHARHAEDNGLLSFVDLLLDKRLRDAKSHQPHMPQ